MKAFIALLTIVPALVQVNAECCGHTISFDGTDLCPDGSTVLGYYCGHGYCNMFGCSCEGGCRKNSKGSDEEAIRLYKAFSAAKDGINNIAKINAIQSATHLQSFSLVALVAQLINLHFHR